MSMPQEKIEMPILDIEELKPSEIQAVLGFLKKLEAQPQALAWLMDAEYKRTSAGSIVSPEIRTVLEAADSEGKFLIRDTKFTPTPVTYAVVDLVCVYKGGKNPGAVLGKPQMIRAERLAAATEKADDSGKNELSKRVKEMEGREEIVEVLRAIKESQPLSANLKPRVWRWLSSKTEDRKGLTEAPADIAEFLDDIAADILVEEDPMRTPKPDAQVIIDICVNCSGKAPSFNEKPLGELLQPSKRERAAAKAARE